MHVYKHRNELDHKIYNVNAKFGTNRYVSRLQPISPTAHWSYDPLVRRPISPTTHWS